MKRYDAVIAGYTCIDLIPDFNKAFRIKSASDFFVPGKLIEIDGMDCVLGGAVPNTGLAMKKFGKKVFLNGLIGRDVVGNVAEKMLADCGVIEGITKTDQAGTAFSIVISPPGIDRIFLESPGCNQIFCIGDINFEAVAEARLFHFGYPPLLRQFLINQGEELTAMYSKIDRMGIVTSLDFSLPDPASESGKADWPAIMQQTWLFVDIFVPSVEELICIMRPEQYAAIQSSLPKDSDVLDAIPAELIIETGTHIIDSGVKILLVKAGSHGVYLFTGDVSSVRKKLGYSPDADWDNRQILCRAYPAHPDRIKNASGAGDTAVAAFLTAILSDEKPEIALKYATVGGRDSLYCIQLYHELNDWQGMTEAIQSEWNEIVFI